MFILYFLRISSKDGTDDPDDAEVGCNKVCADNKASTGEGLLNTLAMVCFTGVSDSDCSNLSFLTF